MGRRKSAPAWRQLERAEATDIASAVETDGTRTDPYTLLATKMFNVPYDAVTAQQRQAAKQATYVDIYGKGGFIYGGTHQWVMKGK